MRCATRPCKRSRKTAVLMRLKLIHRTALYAGGLSLLVCLLVSLLALLAFEWQEKSLLETALQAGVDEMYGDTKAGRWPDLNNSPRVVSAVAKLEDLRTVPAALRQLPLGQTEFESGDYAEFEVLVRQIDDYRYYYGINIAPSERSEASIVRIAIFLLFSAVTISALMGWLFARQLVRPLSAVAQAIGEIDKSLYSMPLARQNLDEIDQIVIAINSYQTRLEAAAARETAFLSDVAHALRTPVAVIQSGLEILSHEICNPESIAVSPDRRDLFSVSPDRRDFTLLERVRRNSQQLVLKLDALMLSARKQELDGLERLGLTAEVEQAMRYLSARGNTSFAIDIATDVYVNARAAVLRWVISQCANSFSAYEIVEISWHAGTLTFFGKDAVDAHLLLPELLQVVCVRERWQLSFASASIRIVLPQS